MPPLALVFNRAEDFSSREQLHNRPTYFRWQSTSALVPVKREPSKQCGNGSHQSNTSVSFGARRAVESSFHGIFMLLERHGASQAGLVELKKLKAQHQYIDLMGWAEKYVECLCALQSNKAPSCASNDHPFDVDAFAAVFVTAWTSLLEYAIDLSQKARSKYSRYQTKQWEENQHWEEFVEARGLSEQKQKELKKWHMKTVDPNEERALRAALALATRFKMDCQKGLVLTKEWARYLKAQQQTK